MQKNSNLCTFNDFQCEYVHTTTADAYSIVVCQGQSELQHQKSHFYTFAANKKCYTMADKKVGCNLTFLNKYFAQLSAKTNPRKEAQIMTP